MADFEYTSHDGWHFKWWGGELIDVYINEDDEYPWATLGVWEQGENRPTISRTQEAFEAECRENLPGLRQDLKDMNTP